MSLNQIIDQPTGVRKGEEVDIAALEAYVRTHLAVAGGPFVVEQFPSGFSNLTYLIRLGNRELVLRRPPFGADIKSAHDMGREFRVLSGLIKVYEKVPAPLLYCDDSSIIGAPFYVMERVKGVILRRQPPKGLSLTPDIMRGLSETFVDTFVALHQVDVAATGLADFGRPEGYIERQISGWRRRYKNAVTDDVPEMEQVGTWLDENMPGESGAALVHNDFKYDNLVLDPEDLTKIIAVLDWEMATVGDPLMDLGTTLAYWSEQGDPGEMTMFGLTHLAGNLNRQQVVERYAAKSGAEIRDPLFYYVYGLYKLAVIVQQIYARYKKGLTQDSRFAGLIHLVRACATMATRALDKNRIYELMRR